MKVGLLGNMNNNHFAVVRFLRDRGIDAELLMFDSEFAHFHPSADSYDLSYSSYCRQLSWGTPALWFKISAEQIRRDLNPFDVLIGCGAAPAWVEKVGRRLDVFVPYGSDLYDFTRLCAVSPIRLLPIWSAVLAQRRGIRRCRVFHMDGTNELYEAVWRKFRGTSKRVYLGLPLVYNKIYSPNNVAMISPKTQWGEAFMELRAHSDMIVLSHGRHVWGGANCDPNQKGTDRLVRGFARFKAAHPTAKCHLVMLEYGSDVGKTKALVAELGLDGSVRWFPRMNRKDVMAGVGVADIVCTEFHHSWVCSGVIYEALAMGKVILGYRKDSLYTRYYPSLYHMLNARSEEEIANRLNEYWQNAPSYKNAARSGTDWYQQNIVDPVMKEYLSFCDAAASGSAG